MSYEELKGASVLIGQAHCHCRPTSCGRRFVRSKQLGDNLLDQRDNRAPVSDRVGTTWGQYRFENQSGLAVAMRHRAVGPGT